MFLFFRQLTTPAVGSIRASIFSSESIDFDEEILRYGGPCRDRTYDQLIKSQLLYQLS
jgi:hypothetical protein